MSVRVDLAEGVKMFGGDPELVKTSNAKREVLHLAGIAYSVFGGHYLPRILRHRHSRLALLNQEPAP